VNEHFEIVQMLVEEFQADVNAKNNKGERAMSVAVRKGRLEIAVMASGESNPYTKLDLAGNNIGSEEAQALAESLKRNTTLTQLNLEGNKIGEEGARALAESLKPNTALTKLNLGHNGIGDKGTCALAESLKQNTTLHTVNLSRNNIGDEGARTLAESLKQNTTHRAGSQREWCQYTHY